MPKQQLKAAERIPSPPPPEPQPARAAPTAGTLRQVAAEAARAQPPARAAVRRRTIVTTLKVGVETADAIADRAEQDGMTQKQIICRALAAYGVKVDPLDLQDGTRRRVRGLIA